MQETQTPSGLDEPSFSVGEFANAVGVHRTTIRRWINRGLVPHWFTLGGHARIPQSAATASVPVHPAAPELHPDNTATSSIPAPVPVVLGSLAPSDSHAEVAA